MVRLGLTTRLPDAMRARAWPAFAYVRFAPEMRGLVTMGEVLAAGTEHFRSGGSRPYEFVVVDEAQDLGVGQLRSLAALVGDQADGLFFAGDLGWRIFRTLFSWRPSGWTCAAARSPCGSTAERPMPSADRPTGCCRTRWPTWTGTSRPGQAPSRSSRAPPRLYRCLSRRRRGVCCRGLAPRPPRRRRQAEECAVFVRSEAELPRACRAVAAAGATGIAVCTMHDAKGLEFRAVAIAACDDDVIPLQTRIEEVADNADLEHVYETERHLLYVACTRARDYLLVTGLRPGSSWRTLK